MDYKPPIPPFRGTISTTIEPMVAMGFPQLCGLQKGGHRRICTSLESAESMAPTGAFFETQNSHQFCSVENMYSNMYIYYVTWNRWIFIMKFKSSLSPFCSRFKDLDTAFVDVITSMINHKISVFFPRSKNASGSTSSVGRYKRMTSSLQQMASMPGRILQGLPGTGVMSQRYAAEVQQWQCISRILKRC